LSMFTDYFSCIKLTDGALWPTTTGKEVESAIVTLDTRGE